MPPNHLRRQLAAVLVIGIGGFAGANLRYLVDLFLASSLLSTLTVNVLGCIALGFLLADGVATELVSERSMLVLATGFTSSFTTYSTFVLDAVLAEPVIGLSYVFLSYALGFIGVLIGRYVATLVVTTLPARPTGGDH